MFETELKKKEEVIESLRRDLELTKRKNNIIFFGVKENEEDQEHIESSIIELIRTVSNIKLKVDDINDVFRLGKKVIGKKRPVLLSLRNYNKKASLLSMKHIFKACKITITEDLPKEIQDEKKRLKPMITALNKEGKKASMRLGEVILNGRKLNKEEIEEEMRKYNPSKRRRSPCDRDTDTQLKNCPSRNDKTKQTVRKYQQT
jgi:hypothetical protein